MRRIFAAFLFMITTATAQAGLIAHTSGNVLGGSTAHTAEGLDFVTSATGGFTSGGTVGTFNSANWDIGGNNTRFGFDYTISSGVIHTSDFVMRVEATNGTFDANVGFLKGLSSGSDVLRFESDGVWTPGVAWTADATGIEFTGGLAFASGDPGGGFVPSVAGASYIEISRPDMIAFSGTSQEQFDINLLSTNVTAAVPEPSAFGFLLTALLLTPLFRGRR